MNYSDASDNDLIRALAPHLRAPFRLVQQEAQRLLDERDPGMYVVRFVQTYRSPEAQLVRFGQGRAMEGGVWVVKDPSKVVTAARPGESPHGVRAVDGVTPAALAADIAVLEIGSGRYAPDGHLVWSVLPWAAHEATIEIESGAFFRAIVGGDWPHLQQAGWRALAPAGKLLR